MYRHVKGFMQIDRDRLLCIQQTEKSWVLSNGSLKSNIFFVVSKSLFVLVFYSNITHKNNEYTKINSCFHLIKQVQNYKTNCRQG